MLFYFACEAAGALSARHSLRPLLFQTRKSSGKTRAHARRDRESVGGVSTGVIASGAKQSIFDSGGAETWIASLRSQ
jgi:hypothetical protein